MFSSIAHSTNRQIIPAQFSRNVLGETLPILLRRFFIFAFTLASLGLGFSADASAAQIKSQVHSQDRSQEGAGPSEWLRFKSEIGERAKRDRLEGTAYMVSGGLVLIGSAIGLDRSDDVLAKTVYTVSQTMSIGAIGYGGYLYAIGDDDRNFAFIIENSKSLSDQQRGEILKSYRENKLLNTKNTRTLRAITHGLIAAVNFYSASREDDPGFKTALMFVGGVNAVAAISIAF